MDSIIPIGQKNTLAEYMILSGVDNRPPMLDKDMYDSWKSKMELYMQNKVNRKMILESIKHSSLIWPTIEENEVTRTKKYAELFATRKIQADCDLKETNIILQAPYPNAFSSAIHQEACPQPQFVPQIEYTISTVNQQTHLVEFPQIDSGLAVPVFKQRDDPIDAINKMMSFLSTVVTSRLPSTNNQLRNSSNPRQQSTIQDGRVTIQPLQGRQNSYAAGTSGTRAILQEHERIIQGKVLLVEAQGNGKVLNEEGLEFLADPGITEGPVTQLVITLNATYQAYDLDANDSDYDEISTAKAVLMDNFSSYDSNILSEFADFEKEINNLKETLSKQSKEKELLIKIFNVFKNESKEKEAKNIDTEIALEKKVKELDNIVCKMGQSAKTMDMLTKPQVFYDKNLKQALRFQNPFYIKNARQIRPMLYDSNVIAKETNVIQLLILKRL
uniref:Uncharacterized protein n=1 Tax=Tanacetum cinerariifolium TaxID=118510 RepID=A0A6L2NDB9_TANCI|nr:hypothetical protein [Tanacetum cinerariifolium]